MDTRATRTARMADCFNYEYQSRSSAESAEVLASLARRMASCIEDPGTRAAFLDVASMSGLDVSTFALTREPRYCPHCGSDRGDGYCQECGQDRDE